MVAPGIAEALIATAAGLFAAIPAVYFYNLLAHRVKVFATEMDDSLARVPEHRRAQLHVGASEHAMPKVQPIGRAPQRAGARARGAWRRR